MNPGDAEHGSPKQQGSPKQHGSQKKQGSQQQMIPPERDLCAGTDDGISPTGTQSGQKRQRNSSKKQQKQPEKKKKRKPIRYCEKPDCWIPHSGKGPDGSRYCLEHREEYKKQLRPDVQPTLPMNLGDVNADDGNAPTLQQPVKKRKRKPKKCCQKPDCWIPHSGKGPDGSKFCLEHREEYEKQLHPDDFQPAPP
ncbi:expressed unknown protein [Seminavis robusta]|uniref:Uncharacterized protein n=1 Tax=Seminavis robusta TaxID=568900 RepID=A0A9N8DTQ7_9STRA|nr:expressed unknown protein [Seminavis robusta]|eukprot:Sro350_g123630.1 n/a (195) ;mRNA; r:3574-4158